MCTGVVQRPCREKPTAEGAKNVPENSAHILQLITNLGAGGAQRVFSDHSQLLSDRFVLSEAVFNLTEAAASYQSANPIFSLGVPAGRSPVDKAKQLGRALRTPIAPRPASALASASRTHPVHCSCVSQLT